MRFTKTTVVLALLVLAAGSVSALDPGNLKRARSKAGKGEKMLQKDDFAGAEEQFRSAMKIEPALPTAYLGLGAALVGLQRFDEALQVLEEAEGRYVAFEQELERAELQARQLASDQQQAFDDANSALEAVSGRTSQGGDSGTRRPSEMTADRLETQKHLVNDRWKIEQFSAIPAQVFYLEGVALLRTGQRDRAIETLDLCLQLDDKHGLANYNLAVAMFTGGDPAGAKLHLDAAVAAGVDPHPQFVADVERAEQQ